MIFHRLLGFIVTFCSRYATITAANKRARGSLSVHSCCSFSYTQYIYYLLWTPPPLLLLGSLSSSSSSSSSWFHSVIFFYQLPSLVVCLQKDTHNARSVCVCLFFSLTKMYVVWLFVDRHDTPPRCARSLPDSDTRGDTAGFYLFRATPKRIEKRKTMRSHGVRTQNISWMTSRCVS